MKIMISPADDEEEEIIIKRNALTADLLAGSHFDKCSTRSISTSKSRTRFVAWKDFRHGRRYAKTE